MNCEAIKILEDGKVFFDYGPVSMVLFAKKNNDMMTQLCVDSFQIVEETLAFLSGNLPYLKKYPKDIADIKLNGISERMRRAVVDVGEPTLTPMATVAGAMSDVVADWIFGQGADIVVANNGGDIAIRLKETQSIRMGIVSELASGSVDEVVEIKGTDGIGGVCTSGIGGRSLTRGIANSVTVFSDRCIKADACATHIANCSYVPSGNVLTVRAGEEDPDSDIADLTIVKAVGELTEQEIMLGLGQIEKETLRQYKKKNIIKLAADIKGHKYRFGI